jgi:hypothetical protein
MKFHRKFAFFIREASILYHKIHKPALAHQLLTMTAKYYQLEDLNETLSLMSRRTRSLYRSTASPPPNTRRPLKDKTPRDWLYLQKVVLQNLVKTSRGINDSISIVRYSVYLLKTMATNLHELTQQQCLQEVQSSAMNIPSLGFAEMEIDMTGIPLLKKVTPISPSAHLMPVPLQTEQKSSIFLYSPIFTKKKQESSPVLWVENELSFARVELSNPMAFPIEIQSISLSTDGISFEQTPTTFVIPAQSPNYEIILSGIPIIFPKEDGNE